VDPVTCGSTIGATRARACLPAEGFPAAAAAELFGCPLLADDAKGHVDPQADPGPCEGVTGEHDSRSRGMPGRGVGFAQCAEGLYRQSPGLALPEQKAFPEIPKTCSELEVIMK